MKGLYRQRFVLFCLPYKPAKVHPFLLCALYDITPLYFVKQAIYFQ